MTTLEQLNRDCPEHDRDSCSDCVDIAHETLHKKIKGEVRADGERINARNDEC